MPYIMIHRRDWVKKYDAKSPLKLRVIQTSGVKVTPHDNIKVTDLKRGDSIKAYKHFLNTGDGGITFKISVIIGKEDRWNQIIFDNETQKMIVEDPLVTYILRMWHNGMYVLTVVTDFIDIPNGDYILTKNPSRTQSNVDYTVWELEFTTYREVNTVKYANNNTAVTNAIAKAKTDNKKKTTTATTTTAKKTTKSSSSKNAKLAACALSKLKYTGNKVTNVQCVKYMQEVLYKKGYLTKKQVDGWFGPKTSAAIKKFQTKYKKTYNLKVTGAIDKATLDAMCKV